MLERRPRSAAAALYLTVAAIVLVDGRIVAAQAEEATRSGQVFTGSVPIPGATIVASQGERRIVTTTDREGNYRLRGLTEGAWSLRVEMAGFVPQVRELPVTTAAAAAAAAADSGWDLALLPIEAITGNAAERRSPPAAARTENGFRQVHTETASAATPASAETDDPFAADRLDALLTAAGVLINGSVHNGAASPFAQLRAFGNNRVGRRSLYNGGIGVLGSTSALDARPYSFSDRGVERPAYRNLHAIATFGGPLNIPGLDAGGQTRPTIFLGVQRIADANAVTQSALMPTLRERAGDFSRTLGPSGGPVQLVDPLDGRPFPGNVIPQERISAEAGALLRYYPPVGPVGHDGRGSNYQVPVETHSAKTSLQARLTYPISTRQQVAWTFAYDRQSAEARDLFRFEDATRTSGLDMTSAWSRRLSHTFSVRARYHVTRLASRTTPYFANRINVAGDAGIAGNDQSSANWGPPALVFSSGIAGLAATLPRFTRDRTHAAAVDVSWTRSRHTVSGGGEARHHGIDINAQQDPRGSFAFSGAASGHDFADFLLGFPATASIATGNPDKYLRGASHALYVSDDWRVSPIVTLNAGIRWEFESPLTERFGRLVNLDVAPDFAAAMPILAGDPVGSISGRRYPSSLLRPDYRGVQPRLGVAWRPTAGSSLVVRGGYGTYRNRKVYTSIATLLGQQPPISNTFVAQTSSEARLTLAHGLIAPNSGGTPTFAVDPDFRVGESRIWQASIQRDLPASLTVQIAYLGTQGRHLMQQWLPNTDPPGAVRTCPACPSGFVYLTSGGRSSRHAGQFHIRRRLRNGVAAAAQYTIAKASDDAAAFAGAALVAESIAQDWRNPAADYAPSSFDQRHLVTADFEYTTGVGAAGGGLLVGWKGKLWRNWTFTGQVTWGSGLPFTPVVRRPLGGTAIAGTLRAAETGVTEAPPPGAYASAAAYVAPAPGAWGSANRNSIRGPEQFQLNASVGRTFPWGARSNLDWRAEATNLLNRATFASIETTVGSPQFGLPNRANAMRRLRMSTRMRF